MANYDATICSNVNKEYTGSDTDCTLFDTGYEYTGLYFEGMFTSPMYYAGYFGEAFMLQYVSNITQWAFGLLTKTQLNDLYTMHIETLWFGTNHW
jgi:hypothetical protein